MNKIEPNFLIIGAAKSATTSLLSLLRQNPDVDSAKRKEPHFFSHDANYEVGWDKYLELFDHCDHKSAIGDASTSYSRIRQNPNVVRRIKNHLPEVKIIYMVRHPLERMESAYFQHISTPGAEDLLSFSDAVKRRPMIIDSSRYWEVYSEYKKYFPEENIKIVWFEEYIRNPESVYSEVCQFLGVNSAYKIDMDKEFVNSREQALKRVHGDNKSPLDVSVEWESGLKETVLHQIREDTKQFLAYFNKPADYWAGCD